MKLLAAAVTLVVAAAAGCSGAPAPDGPATYAEATALVDAARDVTPGGAGALRFTSPSGHVRCDLALRACASGEECVRLEAAGVTVCDPASVPRDDAPELTPGTSVTTADTRCVSSDDGITCVARGERAGFFVGGVRAVLITD